MPSGRRPRGAARRPPVPTRPLGTALGTRRGGSPHAAPGASRSRTPHRAAAGGRPPGALTGGSRLRRLRKGRRSPPAGGQERGALTSVHGCAPAPDLQAPSRRGRPCPCPARVGWEVPSPALATSGRRGANDGHGLRPAPRPQRQAPAGPEAERAGDRVSPPGRPRATDSWPPSRGGGRPRRGWGCEGAAPAREEQTSSHRLPAVLPGGELGARTRLHAPDPGRQPPAPPLSLWKDHPAAGPARPSANPAWTRELHGPAPPAAASPRLAPRVLTSESLRWLRLNSRALPAGRRAAPARGAPGGGCAVAGGGGGGG